MYRSSKNTNSDSWERRSTKRWCRRYCRVRRERCRRPPILATAETVRTAQRGAVPALGLASALRVAEFVARATTYGSEGRHDHDSHSRRTAAISGVAEIVVVRIAEGSGYVRGGRIGGDAVVPFDPDVLGGDTAQ